VNEKPGIFDNWGHLLLVVAIGTLILALLAGVVSFAWYSLT